MIRIFQQTAEALAQGLLPEFTSEQREDVICAFNFLEKSLGRGNVFFQQWHKGSFTEWLSWMNAGLSKLSNSTVSLHLAESKQQETVFLLVKEGEVKQLVLRPTTLKPFEFVCSPEAKTEDWPAW